MLLIKHIQLAANINVTVSVVESIGSSVPLLPAMILSSPHMDIRKADAANSVWLQKTKKKKKKDSFADSGPEHFSCSLPLIYIDWEKDGVLVFSLSEECSVSSWA